jgi:XRE family transcriptional regulator, regulator of sulfur utilization
MAKELAIQPQIAIYRGSGVITLLYPCVSSTLTQSSPPPDDEDAAGDQMLRDFGAQVRLIREQAGLSQETVAARMGVSQPNISEIEGGQVNVSLRTIMRLASAIECEMLLQLLPTGPLPAEARVHHFAQELEKILLGLVGAVGALRAAALRSEREPLPPRRRPGRPRKTD